MAKEKKAPAKKEPAVDMEAAEKSLVPIAREINIRLEKATKAEDNADDHRLAAALRLVEAKAKCAEAKINFKKWVEANVSWTWDSARHLLQIGAAEDPKAALEDLRSRQRGHNKKLREKRKEQAKIGAAKDPVEVARAAVEKMGVSDGSKFLADEAAKLDLAVVSRGLQKEVAQWSKQSPLAKATVAFDALDASDKVRFLAHAAKQTDASITLFGEDVTVAVQKLPPTEKRGRKAA